LTASAIAQMHGGFPLIALAAFGGLILYAMGFLYILNVRLHAQYLGENLSEAPAAKAKIALRKTRPATVSSPRTSAAPALLNSALAALLIKDFRLLLRSGTKLYSLVMPVFVLFLFSFRTAGLEHAGVGHGSMSTYLFSYGCAYAQLIFVAMLYNALGTDGAGVQFYFIAPLRMRDVMLAKNLLTVAILVIEVALMYGASLVLHAHTPNALVAATLAWCAFAFLLNMGIGNVRSLVSPKWYNPGQVRRQNVSGFNSFISLAVVFAATGLGWLGIFLCRMLEVSYWNAAGAFVVLAVLAFGMYVLILGNLDGIAAKHAEEMTRELSKTA
jgi:ABC-2 type transport system permease protein